MRLGDFSSVLQLGVGLHVGTAVLQSIVEFASGPTSNRIERLTKLATLRRMRFEKGDSENLKAALALENDALDALATLELKKVQFFNEYRIAAIVNTCAAAILFVLLVWAAVKADIAIGYCLGSVMVFLGCAPAVLSLATLWYRWHTNTSDIRRSIKTIERKLLG